MPEVAATEKPEFLYSLTTDPTTRRRLEAATIVAHRGRVEAMVRKTVPVAERWEEAVNVGLLGLLIALRKFEPARLGGAEEDQGGAFWFFASNTVRDEIQKFLDREVFWRKSSNRGRGDSRLKNRNAALKHAHVTSLNTPDANHDDEELQDVIESPCSNPEEIFEQIETESKLNEFLSTLSVEERRLVLVERRNWASSRSRSGRAEAGVENGNNARARHYLSLVERATAFVRGNDAPPVSANRETIRP